MCRHPFPKDKDKIKCEVTSINKYGKFVDSVGSPKLEFSYICPKCSQRIEATSYTDIRSSDTST
jgi:hypothetical protein